MKALIVLYDSLNRIDLPPYGDKVIKAPRFEGLAERAATFTSYDTGRLPCDESPGDAAEQGRPGAPLLYDLQESPGQAVECGSAEQEERMRGERIGLMKESDAPEEQFIRLNLA